MKHHTIGLSCNPANRLGHEEIEVQEIFISYGGGMGGGNDTIYATKVVDNPEDGMFIIATDFQGRTIEIGKNFIVTMKPKKLLKEDYDTSMHPNVDLTCRYILMDMDDTYQLVNSFVNNKLNVIRTESEFGSYFRKGR